jgi:hypothetical protein
VLAKKKGDPLPSRPFLPRMLQDIREIDLKLT